MAVTVPSREEGAVVPSPVTAAEAAARETDDILGGLGRSPGHRVHRRVARFTALTPRRASTGDGLNASAV